MNNYCTKCGKKLKDNEFICESCNTPVVDIPQDYKTSRQKKIIVAISLVVLFIFVLILAIFSYKFLKINKLKREYAEPYLEENYDNLDYSIKYDSSGNCVIGIDPDAIGIDGSYCGDPYLYDDNCRAYYYNVETDSKKFIVTVVDKNNKFTVVEGKNINGTDEEIDY